MLSIILVFLVSLTQAATYYPEKCPAGTEVVSQKGGVGVQCFAPCKDGYKLMRHLENSCWQPCHSVCEGIGKPTNLGLVCFCKGNPKVYAKDAYKRPPIPALCNDGDVMVDGSCHTIQWYRQTWIYRWVLLSNESNWTNPSIWFKCC